MLALARSALQTSALATLHNAFARAAVGRVSEVMGQVQGTEAAALQATQLGKQASSFL